MSTTERETKTITTPGGHTVELKSYITGREQRAINDVFLSGAKLGVTGGEAQVQGMELSLMSKAEDMTLKTVVISLDGHKDGDSVDNGEGGTRIFNLLDELLDLPGKDFTFVVEAINEVTGGKKKEKTGE